MLPACSLPWTAYQAGRPGQEMLQPGVSRPPLTVDGGSDLSKASCLEANCGDPGKNEKSFHILSRNPPCLAPYGVLPNAGTL